MGREVVLLTQAGCNPCRRVHRLLDELRTAIPDLEVREVAFDSDEGLELATANSILFPPAVFVRGRLVARGRIHPEPLREAIVTAVGGAPTP